MKRLVIVGERENRVFENREIVAMVNAAPTHKST
jgi:hypothetical protein